MTTRHTQDCSLLKVKATSSLPVAACGVEIDEYVPLQCNIGDRLGFAYVRLGNYVTTLAEVAVEPQTQAVRGVTVTSIEELSPWPDFAVAETLHQLPVLTTTFQGYEVVDVPLTFEVAVRPGEVVVYWANLARCVGYRCGDVSFLTVDDVFAGIWFTGLSVEQMSRFVAPLRRVEREE